uniref:Flavin-containing monooxygenase n=1 Tax=Gasterosteus aculeatus aculeatus TaxID=481459 RepID=G3PP29_GASAC|nr:flavin-containing monooxygenase 5-like [Gasterosteus aculeatus aculeatus]XP_040040713.1 flavin-containing monooxygenase 5-like [Gasterosteus aculeatus aculeatus]
MVLRVAVVGAGGSGLTSIKACVEDGLEPVCFESSDDIGGLWNFKEAPVPQRSSIYRSLVVNTSKEMMCFSDFPMPADYPNFMHHPRLLEYLRLYAERFQLLRHVRFQTTVKSVKQRPDFCTSGQWDVVTSRDGEEEGHVFDAVLVCSGHYTHPASPLLHLPGYETFSGRCLHSWDYKDGDAFRGKRVVVVGIGNSGGDIAVEISRSAEQTFLSTRRGSWVMGRMSRGGLPFDMTLITRLNNTLMQLLPESLLNWTVERELNGRYDHRLYGLEPRHRILDRRPLINDDLPGRILQGALQMRAHLRGFTQSGVRFEDGSVEENIDTVVFCTGYDGNFPFLPPALSGGPNEDLVLYKSLFPPSLSPPTLAVTGIFQTKGPILPLVEMQARWAVKVFSGVSRLPPEEEMLEVVQCEKRRNMKRWAAPSSPNTHRSGRVASVCGEDDLSDPCPRKAALQVDYIPYLDFMAEEVGVRPDLLKLLLTDPGLWVRVFFGPCTPYQYRLRGPGRWAGARQAILTQWERVARPFRTRPVPGPEDGPARFPPWRWMLVLAGAVMAVFLSRREPV